MHLKAIAVKGAFVVAVVLALFAAALAQTPSQATPPQTQPATAPQLPVSSMPQSSAPETQSLHVQVGRSVIVSTQTRVRRVLVSNSNVLETVTVTPTQLVITAKVPGSSSVILWDETGHARILDVYADVDVSGLRGALGQAFPNQPIEVEAEEGRIVLSGNLNSKTVADEAAKMAGAYSKEVVTSFVVASPPRAKQIMLKVRFAEVNRSKLSAFGINILSTGAANTPGTISTQQFGPPTLGQGGQGKITSSIPGQLKGFETSLSVSDLLNIFVFRPDLNLGATIKALQQKNVLQILAEPNLMARSGEPARFLAGGEFPFPVIQGGAVNAITIQFRPFGVRLDFTGTIGEDNVIRLKVAPEVSALDFSNAVSVGGFTTPALSTRRAETEIELRDGQSFGIAGLLDQRTTTQLSKIPGIGDVPILGNLFKSRQMSRSNTELLVLVTPVIVDPVGGNPPATHEPNAPIKNLDTKQFDRNLPDASAKPDTSEPPTKKPE